jgi:malate dehydrogenase (oxaloacetate-decarboxylating)
MDETEVFAEESADVAMEAIKNGVARLEMDRQTVYDKTLRDIKHARETVDILMKNNFIKPPDQSLLEKALQTAIDAVS